MKKLIVVSMIMAIILLVWCFFTPPHAQDPVNEEKPTFYRLTPGIYVNGYPRFTIHYPKDWVERPPQRLAGEVFRVSPPGSVPYPASGVVIASFPLPLDKFADLSVKLFRGIATDVTVVSNKPSQLRDGTPAQELELQMILNGVPSNVFNILTKKGDLIVFVTLWSLSRTTGEDLKAIAYSLEFQPGKDEPVKVPPDVQEFFDRCNNDAVSHDLAKFMSHFSDRYLNSGSRKGGVEGYYGQFIGLITSSEVVVTEFVPAGDRAYLAGFGATNVGKSPLSISIIKENGEWKWYGNQRDVSP